MDLQPDILTGVVTILPLVLLYLRGIVTELGKVTAQALLQVIIIMRRMLRKPAQTTTVVIVVSECEYQRESDPICARSDRVMGEQAAVEGEGVQPAPPKLSGPAE